MRALVIAPQPFFSPRGTPFSVYYRTLVTTELGVDVDLLTYGEGQDVDLPRVQIIRIPVLPFTRGVQVGPSFKKLVLDIPLLLWTLGLLLTRRYDFVHAHEEAVFIGLLFRPIFRYRLVYDMHSSMPQQLANFQFTQSRTLIGLFRWLEHRALAADAVITICPDLAENAVQHMPDPSRHFLIENSIFDPLRLKAAATPTGEPARLPIPEGRRIVAYAGTFEAYQGLDLLIRGFARALQACSEAFLLMVGGTEAQVARYREMAHAHCLTEHCLITGRMDPRVLKIELERAAVLTSPRSAGTNTPLKVYEQLASGIPLVATRIRSHTQVLNDEVCFLVEPTPDGLAEGLTRALTDEKARAAKTAAARALYEEKYSRSVYEQKMRRLLEVLR